MKLIISPSDSSESVNDVLVNGLSPPLLSSPGHDGCILSYA